MGLQGTGGSDGGLLAAPGLAQKLEDNPNLGENANILNLYLNNTSLEGGAPAPITPNVGSISIAPTFVFNGNYTREQYAKAAVNKNISLDSDKRSLLLDSNQKSAAKARAFISSLEFGNGLRTMQNEFSDTDVTSQTVPDLDKFSEYPESMFNNATKLNSTKENFVYTAINQSADATDALASYEQ